MTLELSVEAIAFLIGSLIVVIGLLLSGLRWAFKALIQITQTNMNLNNEMSENSKERQRTADKITEVRDDCAKRETAINAKLGQIEKRAQEREVIMNAEIADLKRQISDLETEIERLQSELSKEKEKRALDSIEFLRQITEKNQEIEHLKKERAKLERRLGELESAMNGKVDKVLGIAKATAATLNTNAPDDVETETPTPPATNS